MLSNTSISQHNCHATIVVDTFRAFTTACYILEASPAHYCLTAKCSVISQLALSYPEAVLIGKPETNSSLNYHIPNSPTRVKAIEISNKTVLHRTQAGANGVLQAFRKGATMVLAAGLVNADATVNYLKMLNIHNIAIKPMGHEARTPSLEDDVCVEYIAALIQGKELSLEHYYSAVRNGAGKYFFMEDQWQYPREDFGHCLRLKRFNFAIQAIPMEGYAVLQRRDANCAASSI